MTFLQHIAVAIASLWAAFVGLAGHAETYVGMPSPADATTTARVIFGGDLMFDRTIRTTAEAKGGDYLFSCLDSALKGADAVVANLEGPITDNGSMSVGSSIGSGDNVTFTFPPSTADLLKRHGISIVNIGNNHIMNFSRAGLLQTKRYLSDAGVQYFGDPDASESDKVLRTEINGIKFSFVNWSDWTSDNTDHTIAQVQKEADLGRVVVVYTHWGIEYVPPIGRVRTLAHEFVNAGASIVIGSHPHIIQEKEVYKGKDIYYSLGNLIFDQYWNDAVRTGLLLDVTFDKTGVENVSEQKVYLERDRTTCPLE